jgi:hypothetical protein
MFLYKMFPAQNVPGGLIGVPADLAGHENGHDKKIPLLLWTEKISKVLGKSFSSSHILQPQMSVS